MVLCEAEEISGRFFFSTKQSYFSKCAQNVLQFNWIVITVAMSFLNTIEVFVRVVYCGFSTKSIIFIIFDGLTAVFALWQLSQICAI